jgi:hypothetical protein
MAQLDPCFFVIKTNPPHFDHVEDRHKFCTWQCMFILYLDTASYNALHDGGQPHQAETAEEKQEWLNIKLAHEHKWANEFFRILSPVSFKAVDSLPLTPEQVLNVDVLLDVFSTWLQGGINKRVYQWQLLQHLQQPDKPIDSWVITLKDLLAHAQIRGVDDRRAQDAALMETLIINVNNQDVAEKLILLPEDKMVQDVVVVIYGVPTITQFHITQLLLTRLTITQLELLPDFCN